MALKIFPRRAGSSEPPLHSYDLMDWLISWKYQGKYNMHHDEETSFNQFISIVCLCLRVMGHNNTAIQ